MASSTTFLALRSPDCNSTRPGMTCARSDCGQGWPTPPGREISRYKIGYSRIVSEKVPPNFYAAHLFPLQPTSVQSSISIGRVTIINAIKISSARSCADFTSFGKVWQTQGGPRVVSPLSLLSREKEIGVSDVCAQEGGIVDWSLSKL